MSASDLPDRLAESHPRVVEIETTVPDPDDETVVWDHTLSGYLVGDGLVLTCAHNVVTAERIKARLLGEATFLDAEVIWQCEEPEDRLDVALLRVEGMAEPGFDRLVWGEHTGTMVKGAFCIGFPLAESSGGRHYPKYIEGRLVPGEGTGRGRASLTVTSARPVKAANWAGLSGAMVQSEDCLLGVVTELQGKWLGVLDIVPVPMILDRPELRRLLGEPDLIRPPTSHPLIRPAYQELSAPTDLKRITARYGQVPFVERSHGSKLADLEDWCTESAADGTDVSVRVLTGQAGTGKTRLAAELCKNVQQKHGWATGFAIDEDGYGLALPNPRRPLLVVFDYVERQAVTSRVRAFLAHLDGLGSLLRVPVRALLVSRTTGSWYSKLGERAGTHLQQWLRGGSEVVVELPVKGFGREQREEHFKRAYEKFAQEAPTPEQIGPLLGRINGRQYESPLLVHIAALLAARGEPLPEPGPSGLRERLLDHLLRREREGRWANEPALSTTNVGPADSDQARHAVAIMTLTEPTMAEAEEFLNASRLWTDQSNAARREAAKALLRLYPAAGDPGRPAHAAPIEPDLVSEFLLVSQEDMEEILTELYGRTLESRHYARMLHILALALDHYPGAVGRFIRSIIEALGRIADVDLTGDALAKTLEPSLPHLLDLAIKLSADHANTALAERLLVVLQRVTGNERIAHSIAMSDLDACRDQPRLARFGILLYEFKLSHFRRFGGHGDLVASLEGLTDVLLRADRHAHAFAAFREAVVLRVHHEMIDTAWCDWSVDKIEVFTGELVPLDPKESAEFLENLVALQWIAGERGPGRYRRHLDTLDQMGRKMHARGQRREAHRTVVFAIDARQALAMNDRDDYVECIDLLSLLASGFLDSGELELAVAAAAQSLQLHQQIPGLGLESLTAPLELFRSASERDERIALKHFDLMVKTQRTLVERGMLTFARLAADYETWANLLWRQGLRDQALDLFHDAVEARRELVTDATDRYGLAGLAAALKDLAAALWESGRQEEALGSLKESMRCRYEYAKRARHLHHEVIRASEDYAAALYELGRTDKALQVLQESDLMSKRVPPGNTVGSRPDPTSDHAGSSVPRLGETLLRMTPARKAELLAQLAG